jgi:hypothetical protein
VGFEMFAELWYDLRSLQQNTLLILGGISVFLMLHNFCILVRLYSGFLMFLLFFPWPVGLQGSDGR